MSLKKKSKEEIKSYEELDNECKRRMNNIIAMERRAKKARENLLNWVSETTWRLRDTIGLRKQSEE